MANANAIVLDARAAVGDAWDAAPAAVRSAVLASLGDYAKSLKLAELRKGLGVSGEDLKPVKPRSRPDGAKGPPLSPHRAASRAQKWLRASLGASAGTVTLWWSHGWGQILGYHRAGSDRLPIRDVIGLTAADRARWETRARSEWRAATGTAAKPKPPAAQVVGRVAYLPKGARPAPKSGKIQVYATGGRARPPRPPAAPAAPKPPPVAKGMPARPKPAAPAPLPPALQPATTLPPAHLAGEVLAAARSVPDHGGTMTPHPGRPLGVVVGGVVGGNKVFIGHAYDAAAARPAFAGMGLAEFKDALVDLNRKGLISLTRADLVEAFHPASVARSATFALRPNGAPPEPFESANFHFIRTD